MVSAILFEHQKGNTKIFFFSKNVKESVLKLRRFAFDGIFSIKYYTNKGYSPYINIYTNVRNLRN